MVLVYSFKADFTSQQLLALALDNLTRVNRAEGVELQ